MDLSGNRSLLDSPLVAFFASRTAPAEALALSQRWAHEMVEENRVVVSGFHSPIERAVLDILLRGRCAVVVTLGRSLYRNIPAHLKQAYEENRLLFLSFRGYERPSFSSSQLRNWATARLASEVVFAPFDERSQLSTLHFTLCRGATPCRILA